MPEHTMDLMDTPATALESTPHPALLGECRNAAGLRVALLAHGALHRITLPDWQFNLFPGTPQDGGPANLWLRRQTLDGPALLPLLGPQSPLRWAQRDQGFIGTGVWGDLGLEVQLRIASQETAWFWHVRVDNCGGDTQTLDICALQDIALAPAGAVLLNEYYVSHYLDLCPLQDPSHGWVLAARQNQAVQGEHPWALMGSLRRASSFATDALQTHGAGRCPAAWPAGVLQGLPGKVLQHEHAMLALQDEPQTLAPRQSAQFGFFCLLQRDHPEATGLTDLAQVGRILALPQAQAAAWSPATAPAAATSLFSSAPMLAVRPLQPHQIEPLWGVERRHAEWDGDTLLSFHADEQRHVVLMAKEQRVQRPHGHILRSGQHLVPDETALTSTVWMAGVFHAMLTQGHVGINRSLSTVRSWLGLYRSHGQRVFVEVNGRWQQLGQPSAFEMQPERCRWWYQYAQGLIEVTAQAHSGPHRMSLGLRVLAGPALRFLVSHHLALGGDDDLAGPAAPWARTALGVQVSLPPGSDLARRFAQGGLLIEPSEGSAFAQVGGDEFLFSDGHSQGLPFVCVLSDVTRELALNLSMNLVAGEALVATPLALPAWQLPAHSTLAPTCAQLVDILPWYQHNALVHYLSPRGLEQFSGGGWGTRDVCQGPLEMLLALNHPVPVRDLLQRVFSAQQVGGDWPQWFMFFERERDLRAGDSHGDVVLWPLLGLARYLLASGDVALLDQDLDFYAATGETPQRASVWQHVQCALAVAQQRCIAGTELVAYGHGDWNDSLQPADPALRERLCSAWTVTLHHQVLHTLASALQALGRPALAAPLWAQAHAVRADFQRLLVVDGVVTGYALFPPGEAVTCLLHPRDTRTGLHYSLLPMMHSIIDNLLSPEQAAQHLALIDQHLTGPDGARLFDRPLAYQGGLQTLFQRAETSAFFGREIAVMYMHAHLRYAEMLAHLGLAQRFFDALSLAHPLGLRERVSSASLRQSNCYFSSSDAAFADRYEAQEHYERINAGTVALDGGWRIYSSGPGIALGLVMGSFLGLRREHKLWVIDPVMPAELSGLRISWSLDGVPLDIEYRPGPQGCGPQRLCLNGVDLAFVLRANPYRAGAAEVAVGDVLAVCGAEGNMLVVYTG